MTFINLLILALGTLAVGSAAIFIVLSGVDPAGIAVWRLGVTAVVFFPFAWPRLRREIGALSGKARIGMVIGGVTFGLHFVLFNTGFHHTSYESTVVLMVAQPLTAALLGYIFLREVVTSRMVISIVLGAVGLVILVWQDYTFKPEHLVGDGIVFACVVAIVITYLFARRLRQTLSYPVYVFTLFSVASVTAAVYMVVDGQSLFHTSNGSLGWISIVVLIVWCTFVGHTSFNYVTKYIPLFYTNIVIISEPVIAILLKYALRSRFEVFRASDLGGLHIAGGLILALGILIGFWGKRAASPNHRDTEDAEAAQRDSN